MSHSNLYEGMFLFPQAAATNLQAAVDHVKGLFARADAEIISFAKWDERRLAYDIRGNKRGVYFLAYFRVDPSRLQGMERDCNLSEHILRAMFIRAEHITQESLEAADGQSTLADEIALRGKEEEAAAAAAPSGEAPTAAPVEAPTETADA